ncbi:hypothetical protein WICANDRAFT_65622 [Wickerhamomyces anomalus NRRL Y-366-8]|uniref:Uncharacterized protein n=1 Tax=Wickerhamomyces anomalus (strain ATCC 58044 / CBS 1984 / NCYC 433 / NRRL Y-366-8) TaxID=683960 RepID=A0A1E3NUN4_WICAA|nr:uncharacterized protein WICANDRAFT_65622 [Wickerhamomyces anomalus NRRL Y-366-8]ODQ56740.1 hypothetical protein WICANDRAFT_65622 [Wickerhamomyces anomalus NRRL Y-366-8]
MSSKNPRALVRFLSNFTKLSSKGSKQSEEVAQSQVQEALSLLKDSKFNFETITEDDKKKYINDFTQILSTGLSHKNEATTISQHFDQSILGLNQLLVKPNSQLASKMSSLDPISVKELISKARNETELLRIYDNLVNNNHLNLSNFRLIIFNKHLRDLDHILNKLNFVNHDGKFDDLKILIAAKSYVLKSFDITNSLFTANIDKWLYLRHEGKLSFPLEKSLYQIIYKYKKNTELLTDLDYTLSSYILLLEAIPRKLDELKSIQSSSNFQLSKNQDLFLNFLSYITSKPINKQSNIFLRKLTKLSSENHVHKEDCSKDSQLTIQKYRFINGISEMAEELMNEYGANEPQLRGLIRSIHETDDLLQNETVLKFI